MTAKATTIKATTTRQSRPPNSKRRRRDHRLAHAEGEQPGPPTRAVFACWGGNAKPEAWVRYKRRSSAVGAAQPKYQCLVACLIPWREHKNPLNLNGPPISRNHCLRASVVGFAFPDPRKSAFIRGRLLGFRSPRQKILHNRRSILLFPIHRIVHAPYIV